MNKLIIFFTFLFLNLNYISCKKDIIQAPCNINKIFNTTWQFIAFDSSGIVTDIDNMDTIFLSFKINNKLEGTSQGLCGNHYNGVYRIDGNKVFFDSLTSTEMACPRSKYWEYYYKLQFVNYFQMSDSQLSLYYNRRIQRLLFKKLMN